MKKTIIAVLLIVAIGIISVTAYHLMEQRKWQKHYDQGEKYLQEKQYEQAILEFTSAIETNEKEPLAYLSRAKSYISKGTHIKDAVADYEKVIQLDENNADAYLGLGKVYVQDKNYQQAIDVYNKGIKTTNSSKIEKAFYESFYGLDNAEKYFLGKSIGNIEKRFGKLKVLSKTKTKIWYEVQGTEWRIFSYPKVGNECRGVAATAQRLFKTNDEITWKGFCTQNEIGYMSPEGSLSLIGKDIEPIKEKVNVKFPSDKYNSAFHWHYGQKIREAEAEGFDQQIVGELHREKSSYSVRFLVKDKHVQPNSLCVVEYYSQYDYWNYKHETKISTDFSEVKLLTNTSYSVNLILTETMGNATKEEHVNPANAIWKSNNASVAEVSRQGVITGISPGNATIMAKYDGKECKVTVKVYPFDSAKIKRKLGVPNNSNIKEELQSEVFYFNAGNTWMFYVGYSGKGGIAGAECFVETCEPMRNIMGYTKL